MLATDRDKWRHVRAVLAKRTPDSELLVHRAGGEIVATIGEKAARVMVLWVPLGIPQARADADLDALSVLWNVAGELLADAEALESERRRVAALSARLHELIAATDPLVADTRQGWETKRDAELTRRLARGAAMETLADDAPGQGGEGSDHGH